MSYHVADGFLGDCLIKYGPLKVTIVAMVHVLPPVQFVFFLAHFHLGASVNFLMDSRSFPQLLQSFFLCFCFICLLLSVGCCFTCFVSLLSFSCRYLEFQFSFPPADTFNFVFSIWGFAFDPFLLKYFKFFWFLSFRTYMPDVVRCLTAEFCGEL